MGNGAVAAVLLRSALAPTPGPLVKPAAADDPAVVAAGGDRVAGCRAGAAAVAPCGVATAAPTKAAARLLRVASML